MANEKAIESVNRTTGKISQYQFTLTNVTATHSVPGVSETPSIAGALIQYMSDSRVIDGIWEAFQGGSALLPVHAGQGKGAFAVSLHGFED